MTEQELIHRLCLQAFTSIYASISHELKNTLAIINENAGLLDDFVMMAGEDGNIACSRVKMATTAIHKQVTRSDKIIKNMNQFSHTADTPEGTAHIEDVLNLLKDLTIRKAAGQEICIEIVCANNTAIDTSIPILEATLYRLLSIIYQTATGTGAKKLTLRTTSDAQVTHIAFIAEDFSFKAIDTKNQENEALCNYLQATLETGNNQFTLSLPHARK